MKFTKSKTGNGKMKGVKPASIIKSAVHGRFISTDFFSRHWVTVSLFVLMCVWSMSNGYECKTSRETILDLENECERAKTERVRAQSMYMSRIRESSMSKLVSRHKLDLTIQDTPPYKVDYNCK